ncbi:MAG: thioredoxin family protein [Acidobacteria bacterium]|nr:thioredoxin family protein [Acidobacteriota bacterium]MCI0625794.1 thioredoxin family protein [Acidobacteriota bacterium]MCI0718176.1 thioredoxin family protein [Acidobacteriota bacterium]
MHERWRLPVVTLLMILGLGLSVLGGNAAGQADENHTTRIQQKMERLQNLVQQRQQQGANLQPVGELMQGFRPLMEEQKLVEAEALLDRALELANNLGSPAQTGPPLSLQQKMRWLQARFEYRQRESADLQPVGELMQGFEPLMQQKKFSEAEALVDRALKLVGESIKVGERVQDFSLTDHSGKTHSLAQFQGKNSVAIIFMATDCAYSNAFDQQMVQLAKDHEANGVAVVGINSNSTERDKIASHAAKHGFPFPVLKDEDNVLADRFGALVTPEVFVLDSKFIVRYHGALGSSNNPTTDAAKTNSEDVRSALEALLKGEQIAVKETKAFGCTIKRVGAKTN